MSDYFYMKFGGPVCVEGISEILKGFLGISDVSVN
jgi:hypothetical protein